MYYLLFFSSSWIFATPWRKSFQLHTSIILKPKYCVSCFRLFHHKLVNMQVAYLFTLAIGLDLCYALLYCIYGVIIMMVRLYDWWDCRILECMNKYLLIELYILLHVIHTPSIKKGEVKDLAQNCIFSLL